MKKLLFLFACLLVTPLIWKMCEVSHDLTANYPISRNIPRTPANEDSCVEIIGNLLDNSTIHIAENDLESVRLLLKNLKLTGPKIKEVFTYNQALDAAFTKIVGTSKRSVQKGEKMAIFGKQLREIYASSTSTIGKENIKDLDFILGRNVMRAEQFMPNEFRVIKDEEFALGRNSNSVHIDYKKYKEYVISFEKRETLFNEAIRRSQGSIIGRPDIREMEAQNLFPVYVAHDMTHVRYGLHHERYMPTLFGAARSKNHKRYVMLAALAEGVDTFQYSEESAICKYFVSEGMNLEEATMLLARATDEELNSIAEKTMNKSTFESLANTYSNWAPAASPTWSTNGVTGVGFDQEVDDMYHTFKTLHTDPDLLEFYNNRESAIKHW